MKLGRTSCRNNWVRSFTNSKKSGGIRTQFMGIFFLMQKGFQDHAWGTYRELIGSIGWRVEFKAHTTLI